ncbi:T9SS type A sorting domain-containing protein [bacterium]|nr:T9SS type A sorting domain-containing protein [bacterium]
MRKRLLSCIFAVLAVLFILGVFAESQAEWHIILNEYFNRDPRNNTWPWRTPAPGGQFIWWYFNTANWPTATATNYDPTRYGWGLQDEYFNTQVTPDAEEQAALWCAYSTYQGPNAPQWPDEDTYMDNQNAWAWWGPFSLEDAISARLSYWYWIEAENLTRDSLSVVLLNSDRYIGSGGTGNAATDFRARCGFGNTHAAPIEDWVRREVYAESLMVNGQNVSYLGEEECYIAFVWQSDGQHHDGTGAYIDDVIVAWDDGLFDLRHTFMAYGFPVGNEDSIRWTNRGPKLYDEVLLRLSYEVVGSNDWTDPFTIDCYIDDELFYRERVETRQGDLDTTYYSTTDNFWVADSGEHVIRWELDTPIDDGGSIEESNEGNNVRETICEVEWNPKPQFEILTPDTELDTVMVSIPYEIHWTIADSNEWDQYFEVFLFSTDDTSGYSDDQQIIYDADRWRNFAVIGSAGPGEHISYFTPLPQDTEGSCVIYFAGVATDGYPANYTFAFAPGFIHVIPYDGVSDRESFEITEYKLEPAYPNPFNRMVVISYALPVAGNVQLAVYDLAGRQVAALVDGEKQSGRHLSSWQPNQLPGGVYMLRMVAGEKSLVQKIVYMP